jgi:squalene-hopene/tetraprenyl-beta-curcumene cyclase
MLLTGFLGAAALAAPAAPVAPPASTSPPTSPTLPGLDPRVDASRITELDLPDLPDELVLPLPPDHRVARRAAQVPIDPAVFARAQAAIARGLEALAAIQEPTGRWADGSAAAPSNDPQRRVPVSVAITALAYRGFMQSQDHAAHPEVAAAARRAIEASRGPDGTWSSGPLGSYVTSVVISALAAADDPEARGLIDGAVASLTGLQWDEGEGVTARADWYGGTGYGSSGRPDLSNTQFMLEALYDAGVSPDEPAVQRALAFVTRTQNLSATNPASWAGDDGGFAYTPANGGESMASELAGEGRRGELLPAGDPRRLRSYGSMSYAGFKSLLYAGLGSDDVRVRAVFDWIRRNYTFDENPGMGQQGLYYYLTVAARALRVGQQVRIETFDRGPRNWREDLIEAILERQRPDGTWVNDSGRWLEGEPALVTAYAILALQESIKPVTFDSEDLDDPDTRPSATDARRGSGPRPEKDDRP